MCARRRFVVTIVLHVLLVLFFFLEFTTATEGRRLGEVAEYADADVHFRSTVKYTGSAAGRSAHCLCTLPTARTHRTAIVLR